MIISLNSTKHMLAMSSNTQLGSSKKNVISKEIRFPKLI